MRTVCQAYRYALDPTPAQRRSLSSHAGAARVAHNFALGLVKDRLDRRACGEQVEVPWTLAALRREWNREKDTIAPWWAENSKEAYSSGLDGLARALKAFSDSRHRKRKGRRVGFPQFKRRRRSRESFQITTGSFGVSGRTRIQLPRIGHVRTHEPTTKLSKKLDKGQTRILSATVSCESGRWFCSFCCEVVRDDPLPARPNHTVGVDVGVKNLAVLSTGERIENPRAFSRAKRKLRRLQRRLDRQRRANNPKCYDELGRPKRGKSPKQSSARQRRTARQIGRVYAQIKYRRRDALHKLTTHLSRTYGTVVVEDLNVSGMLQNRRLARHIADTGMAEVVRQLEYKCAWRGARLEKAFTFYPSSKTCSGCKTAKAKQSLSERTFVCEHCGLVIDRDENAAHNLAALKDMVASSGGETLNARSQTLVRPALAGGGLTANPAIQLEHKAGTASEQLEAA
jgi:putative transposase